MVAETPNIDRIANEGAMFMTYYAEQSCTAGRTAFATGMHPLRAGMLLPQLPGATSSLLPGTPAIAEFLLDLGYNTGEFGKNPSSDQAERRVQRVVRRRAVVVRRGFAVVLEAAFQLAQGLPARPHNRTRLIGGRKRRLFRPSSLTRS